MAISPLPEGTVRQLGSTLVITSPVLLLKELLDNAIDSGATSVDVLVSPNTVDRIEVRDNGHGINPNDFDFLGRPGHTSKLRSFDELDTLGGATLGFRGAALASANTLADVSLTTRVPTEHIATVISLAKGGGIGTQRHVGAPVGTTVSVTGLFSRLPVRLQLAIKEAPKSLAKMKDLLQSYALTRPGLRLRFTVLKTPNLSWSYAPAPNAGVKEAAMQLFGTEFASQCTFRVFPSQTTRDDAGQLLAEQGPIFEALLPTAEADPRKIARGAFLSVDARPVSSTRGTGKRLVSSFRRHLGDHFTRARSVDPPKDPFIKLNIRCPPGSYDVNVEPSKENVLFKDEQRILDELESFLSSVYAVSERHHSPQPCNSAETTRDAESSNGAAPELSVSRLELQVPAPLWRVDMSSGVDGVSDDDRDNNDRRQKRIPRTNEEDVLPAHEEDGHENNSEGPSREGLNPWSIAKLTSRNQRTEARPQRAEEEMHHDTRSQPLERYTPELSESPVSDVQEFQFQSREAWELGHPRQQRRDNPASKGRRLQDVVGNASHRVSGGTSQPSNRQTRPRRNLGMQSPPTSSPHEHDHDGSGLRERHVSRHMEGSRSLVQSQISFDRNNKRRQRRDHAGIDITEQLSGMTRPTRRMRGSAPTHRTDFAETDPVMANFLRQDPELQRPALQPSPPRRPLPQSSCDADDAEIHDSPETQAPEEIAEPDLPIDDPRERLMKQQRLMAQHHAHKKPRRLKTEQLPLETIPRDSQTCTLLLTVAVDVRALAKLISDASHFDAWLVDGKLRGASKNGTGPEDTAALVEPLLARISSRVPVAT